ncbi:DNA double-strand break repair Rad50 ATPase, putative [Entamoeba dispar SAW760]|uniref:DNA double-strand break repair Rad50 ATPase, putative n=1 Tax=Entamoeba dispar (strain ATCC PRA-260 / SAW760) TaxID=370354 RepID=B0EA93_ENTDS|nr:DNA double-strand break repair Rad50 ATPase, putative [Entamoeba dispar SAW760]EDR28543.1 DNA double-strand break repair Rad50 ATPase, putative [Entamoeba dispar SAW760]|eukprot:EDR28543.1 DNA double-strand break repair Rad50 ATPase, putative [Entamoeba dispar SAW760]
MQVIYILLIVISALAAPRCTPTTVTNIVSELNPRQPYGTSFLEFEAYTKALLSEEVKIPPENRTEAIQKRLNQINKQQPQAVNKTQEVNEQIEKINISIKTIEQQSAKVNASIIESLKKINETQNSEKLELKAKMEEVAKEKALVEALNKKKEELRKKTLEYYRLKITAEKIVEAQAEQMRNRRRFIRDFEEAKRRNTETKEAVEKVRQTEHKERVAAIKRTKEYLNNLRQQDIAQEMKERADNLKKEEIAEMVRRKMLILEEKIKTAKIQNNEEDRIKLEKQLIELKRYKKAKIACARDALRKYKLKQQKKVEDLKQKVLDSKLKNKLEIAKNDYMGKIKAELADEIDELKKQKTAFETRRVIAHKKIANEAQIEQDTLNAAKVTQMRKNREYEMNRRDINNMRNKVLKAQKQQLERDATRSILNNVIASNEKRNALDKSATLDIQMAKGDTANKKKIIHTVAKEIKNSVESEKKGIDTLKDKAVKSQQERQGLKAQIARDILIDAHNRKINQLKERQEEIKEMVQDRINRRNRKAALKVNKAENKIALARLQGKLDKRYVLKREEVALKNAKALSDAVSGVLPNNTDKFMKIKTFKVKCGKLAKKMSTPCTEPK